ncbi:MULTISPECIES: hypothetical protein [unclassified Streptomyces]|uniref:hypothetical protein n=1 Tax=unclassified Streptomyces TaxID=2593676 RepID=UPI002E2D5CF0|nr:hypothetical protein [Streptomyces sp. NBC_01439]
MLEPWPEGKYADPEKARERYEAGLREGREARAELFRFDPGEGHIGLCVVLVAAVVVGWFGGPAAAALWVGGPVAVVHLLASVFAWRAGLRGRALLGRAYRQTFGWLTLGI